MDEIKKRAWVYVLVIALLGVNISLLPKFLFSFRLNKLFLSITEEQISSARTVDRDYLHSKLVDLLPYHRQTGDILLGVLLTTDTLDEVTASADLVSKYPFDDVGGMGHFTYIVLGRKFLEYGQRQEAIKLWQKADAGGYLTLYGWHLIDSRLYDEAKQWFSVVVEVEPSNGDAWQGLGTAYYYLSEWGEAANALNRAASVGEKDIELYRLLSRSWLEVGESKNAEGSALKLLKMVQTGQKINPYDLAEAYAVIGQSYADRNMFANAIPWFQQAAQVLPQESYPIYWEAEMYLKMNEPQQALDVLQVVFERGIERGADYHLRSQILSNLGNHEESLHDLEKANLLDPEISAWWMELINIYKYTSPHKCLEFLKQYENQFPETFSVEAATCQP